jgi:hypothetical protein
MAALLPVLASQISRLDEALAHQATILGSSA